MIIPRVGDVWEYKRPGKRKLIKRVGRIGMVDFLKKDGSVVMRPYIWWQRENKGRYTGARVRWLLMYGKRIKTREEIAQDVADATRHFEEMILRKKKEREAKRIEGESTVFKA